MSAIFGLAGEGIDPGVLQAMAARLAHRGHRSRFWDPAPGVHFGIRHGGPDQSGHAADLLAWDGSIDNAAQVATLLGRSGETTSGSGELVQCLVERLGRSGLSQLDGPFALAMWEHATGTLLLARDRTGFRPLFYTRVGGHLLFASEYKALLALADVPTRPNRDAIQRVQRAKYPARDETCLEGIFPVPPGEWVAFRDGEIRRERYWGIAAGSVRARSEQEHVRVLETTFVDVMTAQAEPHDPIGVALSGDLDSTAMLAAMRVTAPVREIHTFTAGYGAEDPQLVRARVVAAHYQATHHEIVMRPEQLPALLPEMVWHMGDPIGREEFAYMFLLGREACRYVSNIFLGIGADGLFGGMPRHLLAHMAFQHELLRRPLADFYNYTQTGQAGETLLGRTLIAAYFRGSHSAPPAVLSAEDNPQRISLTPSTDQPLTEYLRKSLMGGRGRAELEHLFSASNVALYAPQTALQFLAVAQDIPDHLKIRGLEQKYVFRKACEGIVPEHLRRKRKGLQKLQHDRVLSDLLDALADELLAPKAVASRGLFQPADVARTRRRRGTRPYPTERLYRLWTLLMTELWSRAYLDARGSGPVRLPELTAAAVPAI